jgi:AAA+ ATPase superfamily predicted ATPase
MNLGASVQKPDHIFDRDAEWAGLIRFATDPRPGATLGVVSGRRRQGKSYLLQALAEALGGLYFPALEMTEAVSLRLLADELIRVTGARVPRFADWLDAIPFLFGIARDRALPVILDEFPFLVKSSPGLPSVIQRELGPGGSGAASRVRLLLCGSAMSVMGKLLSGRAPLRGRAGLELVVHPFGYRDAARFWGVEDPRLAVLLHSVVGGTPAYRREFLRDDVPTGVEDFDAWVTRTVLNTQTALFREARYLLAEEPDVRDPSLYHSVLAAVATGNATTGGIANYIGRKSNEVAHPIAVLEDSRLLIKEPDVFRAGRATYRIAEPLITFYQAVMSPDWARLERGDAGAVWDGARGRFLSQVVGPHFEALCREFAIGSGAEIFGGAPGEVASGVVPDPANRTQIEVDVAVLAPAEHGRPRRILSLGEVKWDRPIDASHLDRLRRARDLLAVKGFDVSGTALAGYSGAGFAPGLRANPGDNTIMIGLDQLYR